MCICMAFFVSHFSRLFGDNFRSTSVGTMRAPLARRCGAKSGGAKMDIITQIVTFLVPFVAGILTEHFLGIFARVSKFVHK